MMHATVGTVSRGHLRLRAGDRAALAVLLGGDARVGARRVDERDTGKPKRSAISITRIALW